MSTTFASLVAEIEMFLYSYFNDRDKTTTLTSAIGATDTLLQVDDATQIDQGFIEIDYELMAVEQKDPVGNTATVPPWGRGERATVAAAHAAGSRITSNPRFPRSWIQVEINEAISNLYPSLFSVGIDASNIVNPVVITYPVNANAEQILSAKVAAIGPSGMWIPLNRYRFDSAANVAKYPTGKTIDLYESMPPGQVIQVVYRQKFTPLVNPTDTIEGAGLDTGWRDLIKLGASAKMVQSLDAARLENVSVEAATLNRNMNMQPMRASMVAQSLWQVYMSRLQQESWRLQQQYPTLGHYLRG